MPNIIEYIKKAFTKPQLRNEDWLEPSDRVLSNIESAIKEDDDKRKSYPIFFMIFGLCLVLAIFVSVDRLILMEENSQKQIQALDVSEESQAEKFLLESPSTSERKNGDVNILAKKSSINKNISIASQKFNETNEEAKIKKSETKPIESIKARKEIANSSFEELSNYNEDNELLEVKANELNSGEEGYSKIISKPENKINNSVALNIINQLPSTNLGLFDTTTAIPSSMPYNTIASMDVSSDNFSPFFYLEAGTGFTYWNFRLNDDYKALVEPAAFENTNGTGFVTSLTLGRKVNPRLSFSLMGSYETIHFSSGHNSVIVYDNNLSEQTENITMATPLGFVNNEIALFRTADGSTSHTDLLVDLENEHQLSAVEFSLNANIALVQNNKFSLLVSPGFGVQQILSAKNKLTSVDTHSLEISNRGNIVESNFDNVNNLSPFTTLNLTANKELSDFWALGLRLGGSLHLSPIQEVTGLKTNVIRYNAQLVFTRSF
jgi:hypothetical protein